MYNKSCFITINKVCLCYQKYYNNIALSINIRIRIRIRMILFR